MQSSLTKGASSLGLLLLVLIAGSLGAALAFDSDSDSNEPDPPPPPATTALARMLMRSGLDAEALAAVGVTSAQDVDGLVAAVSSAIGDAPNALAAADAAYETDYFAYSKLVREVRSGQASGEEITQCQGLKQSSDTYAATRDGLLDAYFAAGAATLDANQAAALRRIRANRVWYLPVHYLVEDRTQAGWVELSDAIATRRINEQYGEDFPQEVRDFLTTTESDADISGAEAAVGTYLGVVQTAWNAAVTD